MRVITKKRLADFYAQHPAAKPPLTAWHKAIKNSRFADFNDLRKTFGQVDYVKPLYVFNAGNACRLVVAIHFNTQMVFVRHVLTHQDYDRGKWRDK